MVYGMGEQAIIDLGNYQKREKTKRTIKGLCYISKEPVSEYIQIPSHQDCLDFKEIYRPFLKLFMTIMTLFIQKVYVKRLMEDI